MTENSIWNNRDRDNTTDLAMENRTRVQMAQINEKIELLRSKLNDPSVKLTKEVILVVATELQSMYKKMLMSDLEGGIQRQVENFMWNDCFKTPLTHFMRADKALFHWMIEAGVGFYLGFIQDVGIHFDVPFIKNSVRGLYCTAPKMKPVWKSLPSKAAVYYIIQNSMIHVGDLLRYRASFIEALKMYEKSAAVSPSNGHPYNQMGLVQLHIDSKSIESLLNGIYYYVRAVSVSNPFLPAQANLDTLLGKVKDVRADTPEEVFIRDFLRNIGSLDAVMLEPESLTNLLKVLVPQKALSFAQLFRVLVIGLWAWRREADKSLLGIESTNRGNNSLEIIAAVMNGIMSGMSEATELLTSHYLAHLKLCIEWLRLNPFVFTLESFRGRFDVKNFCELVNRFVPLEDTFAATGNELNHVILPEEKKLLGFLPLTKAYEHLTSVMNDDDARGIALRVIRLLKGAEFLAQPKFGLLDRSSESGEYRESPRLPAVASVVRAPPRRNVALQSIFSAMEPPAVVRQDPIGSKSNSAFSSPLTTGPTDLANFSSLFTSIWTPMGVEEARPVSGLGPAADKIFDMGGWN